MAKRLDMRLKMRFRLVRPLKSAMKTDIVFELLSIFMADHNCGLSIFVFDIQLFDIHLFLSYVNRGKEKKEEKFVFGQSRTLKAAPEQFETLREEYIFRQEYF